MYGVSPNTPVSTEDDKWWLHELTYGAEKVIRVRDETVAIRELARRSGPGMELGLAEHHLDQSKSKLERSEAEVRGLIGSMVGVAYETEGELQFVEGIIKGINLKKRTLTVQTETGRQDIVYANVREYPDSNCMPSIEPLIELETSVPHEF